MPQQGREKQRMKKKESPSTRILPCLIPRNIPCSKVPQERRKKEEREKQGMSSLECSSPHFQEYSLLQTQVLDSSEGKGKAGNEKEGMSRMSSLESLSTVLLPCHIPKNIP